MDPVTAIVSGVTAVADMASNWFWKSKDDDFRNSQFQYTKENDERNRQFQRESQLIQNQFASDEATKAYERNKEMTYDLMDYNSDYARVARARAAGINPYFMDAGGQASAANVASAMAGGSAQGGSSGGLPGASHTPSSNDFSAGFANYVNLKAVEADVNEKESHAELMRAQGVNQDIVNRFASERQAVEIVQLINQCDEILSRKDLQAEQKNAVIVARQRAQQELKELTDTWDERSKTPKLQNDFITEQAESERAQQMLAKSGAKRNYAESAMLANKTKEITQNIENLKKQGKLTDKQIGTEIRKSALLLAQRMATYNNMINPALLQKQIEAEIKRNLHTHGSYGLKLGPLGTIGSEGEFELKP